MTTTTIQIPLEVEVEGVLDGVLNNIDGNMCSWWRSIRYDWQAEDRATKPIVIVALDPNPDTDADAYREYTLTAQDIVDAFAKCYGKRVWGQTVEYTKGYTYIGDCLVSDYVLQLAVFGEEVYS